VICVIPVTLQIAIPGVVLQVATALVGLVAGAVRSRRRREGGQRAYSWRLSLEIHRLLLTAEASYQERQPTVGAAAEDRGRPQPKPLVRLSAPC
jgi:hypothetical protein